MRTTTILVALVLGFALWAPDTEAQMQNSPAGCAMVASHTSGCLLTNVQGPGETLSGAGAQKEGRACAINVLRMVAVGDMRIETAMRDGGITKISTVDYEAFELLPIRLNFFPGLYGRYCTVVRGE
jgi:hypothetical protein